MLAAGLFVFAQNPAAVPNRNFLVYMCLWAVSNVAVPEAVLGPRKYAAILVSFVPAAPVRPRLGLLPDVPGESRAPGMACAAPGDPAALPRGAGGGRAVIAGLRGRVRGRASGSSSTAGSIRRPSAFSSRIAAVSFPIKIWALARHAAPRPLAAREPADHGPHARHRPRARVLADLHARAAHPLLRQPDGSAGGVGARAALSARHRVRHRALPPLRRHRGDPPLGGLHDAGRPHHRRVRAAARRRQCARGPARGLDALPVVLGGVHVRRGPPVQPAPRMGAAGGRSHLLPRALRLRADHPGAGPLHGEPARPRRDHAPAHDDHRVGHARPLGAAPARGAACRHRRRPRRWRRARCRATRLAADPRFARDSAPALAAYAVLAAEVVVPPPIPGRAPGAPGAGPEALGGGLYRRRPRAARDGGRPAAVAVANAEARRRVLDYARSWSGAS